MHFLDSPIPHISISPAPPEDPLIEPFSPISFPVYNDDGFRPAHLTPPPNVSTFSVKKPLSPLRQVDDGSGRGLERDRFQALLKASKDRNSSSSVAKKGPDLRKEIALKVHKTKQVERRALFLSKVHAPPSPTAATLPKTPPESPAIFHYSLPSPGLVSPLALFESLDEENRDGWVEQVDFRLYGEQPKSKGKPKNALPSLDQISARLIPRTVKQSDFDINDMTPVYTARPRTSIGVGRLRMPLRTQPMNVVNTQPKHALPPRSPLMHHSSDLHVTTLVVPRSHNTSPVKLTEINLNALNSRGQRAHNMLSTLRRRTLSSENILPPPQPVQVEVQYKWRRHSAPPDLSPCKPRSGFEHAVFALAGGF